MKSTIDKILRSYTELSGPTFINDWLIRCNYQLTVLERIGIFILFSLTQLKYIKCLSGKKVTLAFCVGILFPESSNTSFTQSQWSSDHTNSTTMFNMWFNETEALALSILILYILAGLVKSLDQKIKDSFKKEKRKPPC